MTLTSFKKTGKTNELIMRKMLRTVGRKDLRADRGKLAEPPAIKRELKILRYSLVSNDNVKESLRAPFGQKNPKWPQNRVLWIF